MLRTWFTRLFQSKHSAAAIRWRQSRPASYLPRLETLEDRITPTGGLDPTFGSGGIVTTPIGISAQATSMAVISSGPDAGDYVVAGYAEVSGTDDFTLARYTSAGVLDTTFGSGGIVTTPIGSGNAAAQGVAVDNSTGDYVVAGYSQLSNFSVFTLARYTPTGVLDTTFGSGGIVTTTIGPDSSYAQSVAVDNSTGDYVVAGSGQLPGYNVFALARYTPEGVLDTTFGSGGIVTTTIGSNAGAESVAVDNSSGDYVVAGFADSPNEAFALARYTSAGALDTTFGSGGIVTTPIGNQAEANSVAVDNSTGDYVVAGLGEPSGTAEFALARYTSAGALDTAFGSGGIVTTPIGGYAQANSVAIDSATGDYVVAGPGVVDASNHEDFALARYTPAGVLDTTFGADNSGVVLTPIGSSAYGSSVAVVGGKYVIAGYADVSGMQDFALAEFNTQIAVNPPQNTVPGLQIATENGAVTFSAANGNAIAVYDPEADNGTPQVTLAAANGTLTLATTAGLTFTTGNGAGNALMVFTGTQVAINAALDGLVFTPAPDFYGVATLAISTNDRNSPAKTASGLVSIFITEVAQHPVAVNDYANTTENTSVTIPVLANDYDPNNLTGPGNAGLTVTAIDGNPVTVGTPVALTSGGAATLNADGTITYDPASNASGVETFQYTVSNAAGLSAVGLVTIDVVPMPSPDIITFGSIPAIPLGSGPVTLNAVGGGSSSPVVYTVLFGPGSISGNQLTTKILGTILIEASQAGDANYLAATPVFQTVRVETAQKITFTPPATPIVYTTTPITLNASANSSLPVAFSVVSGPGTVSGNKLTVTGVGSIVVEADQAGNLTYAPAAPVQRTIVVNKANQTIAFNALAAVGFSVNPITLAATASSQLPIAFSVISGPGSITGNQLTLTGVGSVVIQASQAGNADFNAAASVSRTLVVVKASQTITFAALSAVTFGAGPINLAATASSGLPVSFHVVSGPGSLSGNQLTIGGAGSIVIEATQTGNADFNAAVAVERTLVVNKASQTIAFAPLSPVTYGASPITLSAASTSGLAVSFSIVSGPGSIVGTQLTVKGAGAIVIRALQAGNANFNAAPAVMQTLTVNQATLTVTANNAVWTAGLAGQHLAGFTITGFVNSDTQAALFGMVEAALVSCPTVNASDPALGIYTILIMQGTLASPANYKLTFQTGTLTVNP